MTDEKIEKWQDIIRKLMNKAEDKATTPEERDSIMNRVLELMAKFGIEHAMLADKDKSSEKVIRAQYRIDAPYSNQKVLLLDGIVRTFGGRGVVVNRKPLTFQVYAHESDHERIFMLYASLIVQLTTGIVQSDKHKPIGEHARTFRTSFVFGFIDTVGRRIRQAYQRAKETVSQSATGNGMELVLQSRAVAVNEMYRIEHPLTQPANINTSNRSYAGFGAGSSAGKNADIGQTRLGTVRNELGS